MPRVNCGHFLCPLYKYSNNNVGGTGPIPCDILFVGEAPGEEEATHGEPFVGKAGREFTHYLWEIGIARQDVRIENVVKCRPPNNRDPSIKEIEFCNPFLEKTLVETTPKYIVPLGRFATQYFLGDVSIEDVHGIPFRWPKDPDVVVLPVYHPAYGLHDGIQMAKIQDDFQVLKHLYVLKDDSVQPRIAGGTDNYLVKCKLVKSDFQSLDDLVNFLRASDVIAVDTESTLSGSKIDPSRDTPWCITVSTKPYEGMMIMADNGIAIDILRAYLSKPSVVTVLHNALYDLSVLRQLGIYPCRYVCTMTMAYLLQVYPLGLKPLTFRLLNIRMTEYEILVKSANQKKIIDYIQEISQIEWPKPGKQSSWQKDTKRTKQPQGINQTLSRLVKDIKNPVKSSSINITKRLKDNLKRYEQLTGIRIPYPEQASLKDIPAEAALTYATTDAVCTWLIFRILHPLIILEGLQDTLERDMRTLPMIIDMKHFGIKINPQHYHNLYNYFTDNMDKLANEFSIEYHCGEYPRRENPRSDFSINLASSTQISQVLYELGVSSSQGSTAKKAMDIYKSRYPKITKLINDYKEASKLRGTYTKTLMLQADENSRIHCNISTTRTITGRLAMSSPNMQNQPKRSQDGKKIREGFCPKSGWSFLSCDYSQIEMRVAAHVSEDPKMLQLFWDNIDIHSQTASWIFNVPMDKVDPEKHRQPCKTTGFGILYGIGALGIQSQLLSQGLEYDENYCQYLIDSWFDTYPMIRNMMSKFKEEARRYGKVRDIFGRYRIVPEVRSIHTGIVNRGLREACNSPIQMGAAGIIKEAMTLIIPLCQAYTEKRIKPILQIHDDLLFEIKDDCFDEIAPQIIYLMENAVKLLITTPVEAKKSSTNWRELELWIPQIQ